MAHEVERQPRASDITGANERENFKKEGLAFIFYNVYHLFIYFELSRNSNTDNINS